MNVIMTLFIRRPRIQRLKFNLVKKQTKKTPCFCVLPAKSMKYTNFWVTIFHSALHFTVYLRKKQILFLKNVYVLVLNHGCDNL